MQEEDKDRLFHFKEIREKYPRIWPLQQTVTYGTFTIVVLMIALLLYVFGFLLLLEEVSALRAYIFSSLLLAVSWLCVFCVALHGIQFEMLNRAERKTTGLYVLPSFNYYKYSDNRRSYIANTVYNIAGTLFLLLLTAGMTWGIVTNVYFSGGTAVEIAVEE